MTEYNEVMMTEVDQAEWIVKNDPNSRFCFGVDVGGTTIKLGFFSNQGELIDKSLRKESKVVQTKKQS